MVTMSWEILLGSHLNVGSDMMNALLTLGTLSLIGWAQSSSIPNGGKSAIAMRRNEIASSYINTLDVCPQEVPRCPGKAEARCVQDTRSRYKGPPNRENTKWKCVQCEDHPEGTACFLVTPIETYYAVQKPSKPTPSKETNLERSSNNRNATPAVGQNVQPPRSRQQSQSPWQRSKGHQGNQQFRGANQLNNQSPNVLQAKPNFFYQQPNIPYQLPSIPYQHSPLPSYGYQQWPYMTYGQPMLNPYNMYAPQTNAYMQSPYQVSPQYSPQ